MPGDHGAHGTFGDRARPRSLQTWLNLRRGPLSAAAAALLIVGGAAYVKLRA